LTNTYLCNQTNITMTTIEIQVTNNKTLKLLKDLEELHLLRIIRKRKSKSLKLSEQLSGSISLSVAEEMQKYVTKSREEWDRDI